MLKIVGFLMIVASCSAIGFLQSKKCKKRVDLIKSFIYAFDIIKSELAFKNSTRNELFNAVIKQCEGVVGDFFHLLIKDAEEDSITDLCSKYFENSDLRHDEIDEISEALNIIGKYDLYTQQELINKSVKRLESILDYVSLETSKNSKLYRVLGVSTGLIVGLLLL